MYAPAANFVELAKVAEEAGFDQVSLSDHVLYPGTLDSAYPYTPDGKPMFSPGTEWPDVWVMTGALAAVTTRLTFVTHVYVLPARNPFVVAKAVGTAAFLSGDRVQLGIGAGWMKEEFDLLGQPFAGRGRRMEEMVEVLRALWRGGMVEHHGEHYDFDPVEISPVPAMPVPILVGGHSETALRRAAAIGDGWMGVYYSMEELRGYVERLERYRKEVGREHLPFEITASVLAVPTTSVCDELDEMGVTTLITSAWLMEGLDGSSLDENRDALRRFGERYIQPVR
jgi:probable F420-dependent oxidoreductase